MIIETKRLQFASWAIFLFPMLVIPNSVRFITLPLFISVGVLALIFSFRRIGRGAILTYSMFASVSLFYILVGVLKIGPAALDWVVFVYLFSPLLWLAIWTCILSKYSIDYVIGLIIFYGVIGAISVIVFIQVFGETGGASLTWLIAEPNVQIEDGRVAATMHVFGPLIFIVSGFIASPKVIERTPIRIAVLALLITCAFISGRSALVVAIFIGVLMHLFGSQQLNLGRVAKLAVAALAIAISVYALSLAFSTYFLSGEGIDFKNILADVVEKILEGGGDARAQQFSALLSGLSDTFFLGAGHGVGVEVIRNESSPWKYELLWMSTLFHVGLFGFLIYLMPAVFVAVAFVQLKKSANFLAADLFVLAGFVSIIVASMTNPYLESFDFQWMVIFPCVYFYRRYKAVGEKS